MTEQPWRVSFENLGSLGELFMTREAARDWLFAQLEASIERMRAEDPTITEAGVELMRNDGRMLAEVAVNESRFPQPELPRTAITH
jgi:ABC-type enterochelin transport system substrate-binding protein